jgi:hypothetical protein
LLKVGQLIGLKLVSVGVSHSSINYTVHSYFCCFIRLLSRSQNEFVAYNALQNVKDYADLSDRSRLIATYALCGFANIGSLGNQIGVLSQISPGRSGDVSRVAVSAMLTGAISTFTSATIAGLLITDEKQYFTSAS